MRFCCVVVVLPLICVLAGCLVAHAAPRRGGGGNSDPRWKRNFSPPGMQSSGGSYNKGDLVERVSGFFCFSSLLWSTLVFADGLTLFDWNTVVRRL